MVVARCAVFGRIREVRRQLEERTGNATAGGASLHQLSERRWRARNARFPGAIVRHFPPFDCHRVGAVLHHMNGAPRTTIPHRGQPHIRRGIKRHHHRRTAHVHHGQLLGSWHHHTTTPGVVQRCGGCIRCVAPYPWAPNMPETVTSEWPNRHRGADFDLEQLGTWRPPRAWHHGPHYFPAPLAGGFFFTTTTTGGRTTIFGRCVAMLVPSS